MIKRKSFAIIAIGLTTLLASACTTLPIRPLPPDAAGTIPATQDPPAATLHIGWTEGPDTLHPGLATTLNAFTLFDLVYSSLYRLQPDGTSTPELVTEIQVTGDGMVWTFTIRDDVTWHDGEPLTAHDVAYSLDLYRQTEAFATLHPRTAAFAAVEATDDTTVVLTLNEVIPNLESQLLNLYILPEHIWSQLEGDALSAFENRDMIGSGPFQLVDYRQGERVHLAVNPTYVGALPQIDGVIFQTFDTPYAGVQALRNGAVDMITDVPKETVPGLRNTAEQIAVVTGPPLDPLYLVPAVAFNQMTPAACPPITGRCTGHPALLDRTVRLALAHATDQGQLISGMRHGMAAPGLTLIPDSLGGWFNDSLEAYAYDPALANQLLDEAGYLDHNGDGVREMPDGGEPLILRMNWPSRADWAGRVAELLREMWRAVGVDVEMAALDWSTLETQCCPAFDYDVIVWGWGHEPDPHFLLSLMHSEQIASGLNETGYRNPAYDALFARQATTLEPQARRDIVWEMQRLVYDDVVYLIPFYRHAIQSYRTDRFTGWITDAPTLDLADVSSLLVVEPVE